MSNNEKKTELNEEYIIENIKRINELYSAETFLNEKILNTNISKNEIFVLFNKNWLIKWKNIVGFEDLKIKCKNCETKGKISQELINDIFSLFKENNTKEKLDDLGEMDCSQLQKKIGNLVLINEKSEFIPILSHQCTYFVKSIKKQITVNAQISNGVIYIHDPIPEKNKEKKLILLYKQSENDQDFIKPIITLEPKIKIQDVVKKLKTKKIDEILAQSEYKIDIVKPNEEEKKRKEEEEKKRLEEEKRRKEEEKKRKEEEEKKRLEDEKKRKAEEEKKRKEEEEKKRLEDEIKRKEEEEKKRLEDEKKRKEEEKKRKEEEKKRKEEEEKKRLEDEKKRKAEEEKKRVEDEKKRKAEEEKRIEEEKKKKEEEEKKKKEEEEKKQKEEEEKKKKEEEEKKKKEEEQKKQKEEEQKKQKEEEQKKQKEAEEKKLKEERLKQEIERRKIQQEINIKKEKEENDKINKEREREVNKKYNDNIQNIFCDAIKKQISFEEKIKQNGNKKDENFIFLCKIIKKEYLNNFEKTLNYGSIKEQINKNPNDADKIFQNAINNKVIKANELENIVPRKIEDLVPQALVDIEKLAFVDDEFAAKILQFVHNSNQNINNQNNNINQINNHNSPLPQIPKANIVINNGAGIIQTQENNNQIFTMNFKNNNINQPENIQVFNFPKDAKFDIIKQIPKKPKNGLIQDLKNEYISRNQKNDIDIPKPIKPENQRMQKPRKTLDGRDCSLGLDNVGATCYMNATLQCLAHLKRITEHIINYREDGKIKDNKKYKLCDAYSEVVCEIWKKDSEKKSFAPNRFKKVIGEMNSIFAPTAANDAKDLLIFFIEQMHSELNVSSETNLNLIMPDDMNPMDHQQVLRCFVEEFIKKYNSVFSHYCYGSNVSITNCNGCGVKKYSYQCFSFIIFPLLEAKKNCVLEGRLNPMFYNNYILNIADCFQYNQKIEFFNGSNQMYCNICQGSKDSWMQTRISSPPLVLILILNRGKGNLDFREPFIFWESIDLTGYLEFPLPDNKYFLSGVVSHMGDSGPSGHFIAYCRMSEGQKWYCYNDSIVSESNFQEINSRGFPYILFYQKSQM